MPDITMCPGTGCPMREQCYRYMATPNPYQQSFADFTSKIEITEDGEFVSCPEFILDLEKE